MVLNLTLSHSAIFFALFCYIRKDKVSDRKDKVRERYKRLAIRVAPEPLIEFILTVIVMRTYVIYPV